MALPSVPVDRSGGYMLLRYRDSATGRRHSLRLHVVDYDDSYAYSGSPTLPQPTPSEAGLSATFTAFANHWKLHYANTWKLSLRALFKNIHANATINGVPRLAGVPFRIARPSGIAAVAGTGLDVTTGIEHAVGHLFNFNSSQGGRYRLHLVGRGGQDIDIADDVVANAGGTDNEKLVAYLSGTATGIIAHDGSRLDTVANLTATDLQVLRRKYEFA